MPPGDVQQLSEVLRHERERRGLTVRQLADAAGLVPSTVSRIETGFISTPRPDHLQRIARVLGIDAEELYAAVGYLVPSALPELRLYLRAKYGLAEGDASRIEGYVQALRDTSNRPSSKEGSNDHKRDQAP